MDGFRAFVCPHSTTTEPDERGQGLCLACGVLVQLQLTRELFERYAQAMLVREVL